MVAFYSYADNLVSGDTNDRLDVFVHDRRTGQTTRVSVDSAGLQGNGGSLGPSISADGRFVAFRSYARNLIPGDTNGDYDIFVHDRETGQTTRVSVDSAGAQGNGDSYWRPSISADGRFVTFYSYATNLVPGDTNGFRDVFVHDRQTAQTTRVSVDATGVEGNGDSLDPTISTDGGFVAFRSYAGNLVPADTNGAQDLFVHDRQTGQITRISVDSAGAQGNSDSYLPSMSADGRFVAFYSLASNFVPGDTNGYYDVFVHDRQIGQTTRVSVDSAGAQGNTYSWKPSISADGRLVAFGSAADNLVAGDTNASPDVFVHDRRTGKTIRVSVNSAEVQGDLGGTVPSISADGLCVGFESYSHNLVHGDTNGTDDGFVYDSDPGLTLATSGVCPGPMTFAASNATPGGTVAFIWGTSGSATIPPGKRCAGSQLDLAPLLRPLPGYLLAAVNGSGLTKAMGTVPSAACGLVLMQAVDLATCQTSNTVSL